MRILQLIAVILFLYANGAVIADGCYVPRKDWGAESHARNISEPSQKALIYHCNGRESLIIQVTYKGDVDNFCWLVPTPAKPEVSIVGEFPIFHLLHQSTAPVIKYWLDADRFVYDGMGFAVRAGASTRRHVEVVERKQLGKYDISVLRARNADALNEWLNSNGYHVTSRYTHIFDYYLKRGWVFTAAKISAAKRGAASVHLREGTLAPLRLDFKSQVPIYPLKISSLNPGPTKLLLYTITRHRMTCPGFKTECAKPERRAYLPSHALFDLQYLNWSNDNMLTKLSAELLPSQMNADLVLRNAKSDEVVVPPYVSPPFVENVGAVSVLLLVTPFVLPFNILTCCIALIFASSLQMGHLKISLRWIALIAILAGLPMTILMAGIADNEFYRYYGAIGYVVLAALLVLATICVRRRSRRSVKNLT